MSNLKFIFIVLLVGCGSIKQVKQPMNTETSIPRVDQDQPTILTTDDPDVSMIADEFYADAQSLGHAVNKNVQSIGWADNNLGTETINGVAGDIVGECIFYADTTGNSYSKVVLDKNYWTGNTVQTKRSLLYHELGHCALSLNHQPPNSGYIMQPSVLDDATAEANWLDLVRQEFASSSVK